MIDLLDVLESPYITINRSLGEVRELFHRKGRIADANAKLDETIKLMAVHYAHVTERLSEALYKPLSRRDSFSLQGVNDALSAIAHAPPFTDGLGHSIFGPTPAVAFEKGEEDLAFELFKLAGIAITAQASSTDPLDVVNEAFGHHVRDNFRSNTEDAQYMTPPEVVDFMIEIAKHELLNDIEKYKCNEHLVVCDPSCGVGSFLVSWHRLYERDLINYPEIPQPMIIGQDKVDRMARLGKANHIFSGFESDKIYVGSSIEDGTPISQFDGKVDLILTNPPFGARFNIEELRSTSCDSVPFFSSGNTSAKTIDSEDLFIERYLTLLRPGGLCIVVVPDSVISAKGPSSLVRQLLARSAELIAVIELPPVTFAQAGTRTKTTIIAFRKCLKPRKDQNVFFAEAHSLGFEVSKRKGVSLKRLEGKNELIPILSSFQNRKHFDSDSGTFADWKIINPTALDAWTPRRFRSLKNNSSGLPENIEFKTIPLYDLVKAREKRKPQPYSSDTYFISILHVIGEGILDIPTMIGYRPITPGIPITPGSIIFSRLNPRIPRVMVVPDLGRPLLCSSEFEILEPVEGISPYAIAFLMLSGPVQAQIATLTAGTSASHSRVRPDEIRKILLPWPLQYDGKFSKLIEKYKAANQAIVNSIFQISSMRSQK